MNIVKYWLWLASLNGIDAYIASKLFESFGSPEAVYNARQEQLDMLPYLAAPHKKLLLGSRSTERAERILEACDREAIRIVTRQDAAYPTRLASISDPPPVLYVKGHWPLNDIDYPLAVVGTRKATQYGLSNAERFGYHLARMGMLVTSGMAAGIDAASHRGALKAGRQTLAVLGCGVDYIYPYENKSLYEDIISAGAVISEYPPGTKPDRTTFPARNRIMTGLSLGVLVVEAPRGSGALISARHAAEQGRDVFAIPGNINIPESEGSHELIRDGAALVHKPEHIRAEYNYIFPAQAAPAAVPVYHSGGLPLEGKTAKPRKEARHGEFAAAPVPKAALSAEDIDASGMSDTGKAILRSLIGGAQDADGIVRATGISSQEALGELTILELGGYIRVLPGQRYEIAIDK